MWRQVPLVGPYIGQQQASPRKVEIDLDNHSHSPRRGRASGRDRASSSTEDLSATIFARTTANFDPFVDHPIPAFGTWRHSSGNDVSMRDYTSSASQTRTTNSRQVTDPMSISVQGTAGNDTILDSLCDTMGTRPPANTPQNGENVHSALPAAFEGLESDYAGANSLETRDTDHPTHELVHPSETIVEEPDISDDLGTITVHVVPAASQAIKGRKENAQQPAVPSVRTASGEGTTRKVSQTFSVATLSSNNKRQRVTPAASKAIDDEDEPRTSPVTRKVSRTNANEGEGQKRVLSNMTNV